ncbi:cupin domain-containing protein [Thioclava sp. JE_KL1]|uniref:cupin domain-containing protein n=1 Tax=Thioclava sp. JE_KL1 TaxID=2651187 RepID=UPI00128B018A|nr:cupin domain-containing protein [Thioclava sp. JE_KL1]MPQ92911.1 cupin domain-containing protein [Thioclava sp. JE_KL1]
MSEDRYLIRADEIAAMEGLAKTHFLNPNARRINKSLGDATGLTGIGVHIIEVEPGCETTEFHRHHHEDEAIFVLSGKATARIGEDRHAIGPGDFIGYRARGAAHTIENTGSEMLRLLVMGQRLSHDVGDYPDLGKRLYRNAGMPWQMVDADAITEVKAGAKK